MTRKQPEHILKGLVFPARYEALVENLGSQLSSVLVDPEDGTKLILEDAAAAVSSNAEGVFLPMHAAPGTGKTTLANNLHSFLPSDYTPTVSYSGSSVTAEDLDEQVRLHLSTLPANEAKVVPVNIDNREGSPASEAELAAVKRFLRMPGSGSRAIIIWPDTSIEISTKMSAAYKTIVGQPSIPIPVAIQGPPRATWPEIAKNTLRLANSLESLELLGVNPDDYLPGEHSSLGAYLRTIANDFRTLRLKLLRATRKPLKLAILFASENNDAGVLTHLTSSNRFGLLDGTALLDASPGTVVGRWWNERRGILTQTIMRLDARVFCLPPSASVGIIRRYGTPEVMEYLNDLGIRKEGDSTIARNISRSDIGKYILGKDRATFEASGTPTTTSLLAFEYLAQQGFTHGRDKALNKAMSKGLEQLIKKQELEAAIAAETKLDFCPLIPDNSIEFDDQVICLEYTWRKGKFLETGNRGAIAKYCLEKLQGYAREMNWA